MASETTAAAVGTTGVVRRDPMAMQPFCGYNFGDYWDHWLSFERVAKLPRVFHVNWFRQNEAGRYLWPGFGDNLRVLQWILERCEDRVGAQDTPIGYLPHRQDLALHGLDLQDAHLDALLSVDRAAWRREAEAIGKYLEGFGARVPKALREEHRALLERLGKD